MFAMLAEMESGMHVFDTWGKSNVQIRRGELLAPPNVACGIWKADMERCSPRRVDSWDGTFISRGHFRTQRPRRSFLIYLSRQPINNGVRFGGYPQNRDIGKCSHVPNLIAFPAILRLYTQPNGLFYGRHRGSVAYGIPLRLEYR